ncbi:MAG: AAA family ATPase [Pauljensenia sp.]|jgi:hypothetical protein|uniref:AAA family ATPase n=1 Tax=Actinomyces sp. oral taxon 180 TaxID=651609 RepID=UPI0001F0EC01|nr:AAA family ATPase [Actinomyces sp. oral taxon 180]EFU60928.1 conserved hypothetical protein [Actinomyces sp. oral taxon 180 str. F0310]
MEFSHVRIRNWKNFRDLSFDVGHRLFIVGPNAAGKSNLLDVFRFLGDIVAPGGGMAQAVEQRGGLKKVRSLFSRQHPSPSIDVKLRDGDDEWRYVLVIRQEGSGHRRVLVEEERVEVNGKRVLKRPTKEDKEDAELLTQTYLEQKVTNKEFRKIADFFAQTRYFHPVPQVIRGLTGNEIKSSDPYGSDFIRQISETPKKTQDARLRRVQAALQKAIPEFEKLRLEKDSMGVPHLEAAYKNWRPHAAWQNETQFSDGTLRLLGLLWTLVATPAEKSSVLLLEEPELSLHSALVSKLPRLLAEARKNAKGAVQVILSSHATEVVDDDSVGAEEVLVLLPGKDGTKGSLLSDREDVECYLDIETPFSEIISILLGAEGTPSSGLGL